MELTNRDTLEADFARKISRLTNKKRKELEQLLGNPPDVTKVPPQFWADAERELNNEMILLLILIAASSYTQHGGELVPPSAVSPFDRAFEQSLGLSIDEPLPPEPIIRWAAENSGNVASEWSKHSQDILNSAQKDWTQTTIETGEHPTKGEIRDVTLRIFGPGRASRISVNETTRSQHFGSEHAIAMTVGLSPDDIWKTSEDDRVCPICSPLDNQPRSYWWRFFPDGPPDPHPLCRCYILYKHQPAEAVVESKLISESWDEYLHPRDDRGRFIDKAAISAARRDKSKAISLIRNTTDPMEREKLVKSLGQMGVIANNTVKYQDESAAKKQSDSLGRFLDAADQHDAGMSPEQRKSIEDYRGLSFDEINSVLRGKSESNGYQFTPEELANAKSVVKDIDSAMRPLPELILYRGVSGNTAARLNSEFEAGKLIGTDYSDPAFTSTAASQSSANYFVRNVDGPKVMLSIRSPEGASGIAVKSEGMSQEHEVILPRNSRIKIVSAKREKGVLHINGVRV